jgi:hypothetical protein
MTPSTRTTPDLKPTRCAPSILALFVLASSLALLVGIVVLIGTRCSAIFGFADALSLPELALAAGSALAFSLLGALIIAYQPGNRIGWLCGAIAAQFTPLRRRIQDWIDRRFSARSMTLSRCWPGSSRPRAMKPT